MTPLGAKPSSTLKKEDFLPSKRCSTMPWPFCEDYIYVDDIPIEQRFWFFQPASAEVDEIRSKRWSTDHDLRR